MFRLSLGKPGYTERQLGRQAGRQAGRQVLLQENGHAGPQALMTPLSAVVARMCVWRNESLELKYCDMQRT